MIRLNKEQIRQILLERFEEGVMRLADIPHPHLLEGIQKAAARVAGAIRSGEKIAVVGDYDVDGVVSAAIMADFFDRLGYPVSIKIPNRFCDGYGLSPSIIDGLDADVVVTVDNGIAAFEAARICQERGIDLIITDHHTPSRELPDAYAIINPKQSSCRFPFEEICGAQVAWFFIAALKNELGLSLDMGAYLDLLSIAIIADVMPLRHINRPLVLHGIERLNTTSRPFAVALRDHLGKKSIGADDIAFLVAPRLNSAGRMADGTLAFEFLTAKEVSSAHAALVLLGELNEMRKQTEQKILELASPQVDITQKVIVVSGKEWHEGVVGIVAARLAESFVRPAIVLNQTGRMLKGSARSVGNVDIYALLDSQKKHLAKFGGHKMAAGLSLDIGNLDAFTKGINQEALGLDEADFHIRSDLLGELDIGEVDFELLKILDGFEPYGEGNPRPKFLARDCWVEQARRVGKNQNHLRLILKESSLSSRRITAICFRFEGEIVPGDRIDCIYSVLKNEFNQEISVQLLVEKIIRRKEVNL